MQQSPGAQLQRYVETENDEYHVHADGRYQQWQYV